MKIISIKQPWAWLIVHGKKDVENRSWPTKYRGPILVHAPAKPDRIAKHGLIVDFASLDRGGIVGITEIVDCVTTHPSKWFTNAGYAFVLRNSRPLPFIPCNGALGIRDVDPRLLPKIKL